MIRRLFTGSRLAAYGSFAIWFLLWRPFHDGILRYGLIAAITVVWAGLLNLAWKRRGWRIAVLLLPLLMALPFVLPGRTLDQQRLRERYLESMKSFDGTKYVWGGENRRGIDCSGLPRAGLRSALADQALLGNGHAARLWLEQWWFDTSAKAMAENYRGFTRDLGIGGDMRKLDLAQIQAGDLAVTMDRRHVMIYLGGGEWIQADPGPGKVFTSHAGSELSFYLSSHVTLCRWTALEDHG
ncbi:NlpC/P60 family protein [Haloferula sp. BvORR071]|uniref:NlpC/P60 family protein n=1 Tax=Haloferula sp. BvORR071 TaxID=1396141 RepID=UPI00054FA1DC|nr:NlpC/P60 family protein [Haloferula sp. BvORR071]